MTAARIIFAGDGATAARALAHLADRADIQVMGLLVHSPESARDTEAMRGHVPDAAMIEGDTVNTPAAREQLAALAPDWLISLNYAVILRPETLSVVPPNRAVNIHTGLLPEQRGRYPNFWALYEGRPGGVTMHVMTPGIDEGDILARREVPTEWTDTAETLYARLQETALALLAEKLTPLLEGRLPPVKQTGAWPTRRRSDFLARRHIDLDAPTTARSLFNHLRAFAYTGDPGVQFEDGGQRYSVSIKIARINPGS